MPKRMSIECPKSLRPQHQFLLRERVGMTGELLHHRDCRRVERLQSPQLVVERLGHPVDDADLHRLGRRQSLIAEEQPPRGGAIDRLAPARRPAEAGHDAEPRAGMREAGARGGGGGRGGGGRGRSSPSRRASAPPKQSPSISATVIIGNRSIAAKSSCPSRANSSASAAPNARISAMSAPAAKM